MWDLIVLIPDHCLSNYLKLQKHVLFYNMLIYVFLRQSLQFLLWKFDVSVCGKEKMT